MQSTGTGVGGLAVGWTADAHVLGMKGLSNSLCCLKPAVEISSRSRVSKTTWDTMRLQLLRRAAVGMRGKKGLQVDEGKEDERVD